MQMDFGIVKYAALAVCEVDLKGDITVTHFNYKCIPWQMGVRSVYLLILKLSRKAKSDMVDIAVPSIICVEWNSRNFEI